MQHRPVANAKAGRRVRGVENSLHLVARQVGDEPGVGLFGWNGEDTTNLFQRRWDPMLYVLHKGLDSGKSNIASTRAIFSFDLEVLKKIEDERCVDMFQLKL
jgi:hypothetical protein